MKKILISQIDKLEDFDIVELIGDKTKESIGYFVNVKYTDVIQSIKLNRNRLKDAIEQIESEAYILKDIDVGIGKEG